MRRLIAALSLVLMAGCTAEWVQDPPEEIAARAYVHDAPPSITLYTVINKRSGAGEHSGLMINGAQRVVFDPAGTFQHPAVPEQNDVLFGITENIRKFYIDYHARETFDVLVQEIEVSPQVAAAAIAAVRDYGAVPKAQCSIAVSRVLRQLPGFEAMPVVWFPRKTSEVFGRLPGVREELITDDDADRNHGVLLRAALSPAGP